MWVDLNADVAESGDDLALFDVITSANVCCGAYAGDVDLMIAACQRAVTHGTRIGAQVGYPDPEGFGRRPWEPDSGELIDQLRAQIDLLADIADEWGVRVAYVKPHGALYNTIVSDERQAAAVVEAVAPYGVPLMGLPGSASLRRATALGLPVLHEGFADRAYTATGALVPRNQPGALLSSPSAAAEQAVRLAGAVDSLCVHGDTPGALVLAHTVRNALDEAGIGVRSPA